MLSRMLRNPAYAGGMVIDGETAWPDARGGMRATGGNVADSRPFLLERECSENITENITRWHEPLIDRADWERLQALLTTHATRRSKPVESWLEGLVRHACGERMYLVGTTTPRGTLLPVFRCKRRFGPDRCAHPHGEVSATNLEAAARTALIADRRSVLTAEQVWRALQSDGERRRADQRRAMVAKRIAAVEAKRVRAEEMRLSGDRPFSWWVERDRAYAADLAALAAELAGLPDRIDRATIDHTAAILTALPEHPPSDDVLALSMRELGIVAVVGNGGVVMSYPERLARFFPEPVTVRIYRARTK